jgi:oligopeptide transport system ATP-binding protein
VSIDAIRVDNLHKSFRRRGGGHVPALDGVSFNLGAGGSLGIVGESGSGKTTAARMIVGLEIPTSGTIEIFGQPRPRRPTRQDRKRLAKLVQMVFQDPNGSLDPVQSIGAALEEVIAFHASLDRAARASRVHELLDAVGVAANRAAARPAELSGGQRQRVAIARALAAEPKVLVLDEAVSALDVSIQAQVLNLLVDLRGRLGLAYLVISHDIAVVRHLVDNVAVMLDGRIVETGPVDDVLRSPTDKYTRRLIAAIPATRSSSVMKRSSSPRAR